MSATLSTLDQGHEHASIASDYLNQGLLVPAAEHHFKAADAFQKCVDQSTDEHTKNTLRKLCYHHSSVGKDLQERIAKLKEVGRPPDFPQPHQVIPAIQKAKETDPRSSSGSALHVPLPGRNIDSSTTTFDESFMVLNQQSENGGEDSPFDLFWKVTGEIMYNLSQPMSFQTAAMAALEAVESRTASQSNPEGDNVDSSKVKPESKTNKISQKKTGSSELPKPPKDEDFDIDDDDYDSLDDFCLVPSSSTSGLSSSTRLKQENAELKAKLESMDKQMGAIRRQINLRNEQDQHLRDNIMLARKEAQRAMAASTTFGTTPLHSMSNLAGAGTGLNVPQGAAINGRDRETALLRRIRELEDDLRAVRLENDKQKATIAKFRERWERLKESAKRKKSAKAIAAGHADPSTAVRDRIDEDPEGEAAAENSGKE